MVEPAQFPNCSTVLPSDWLVLLPDVLPWQGFSPSSVLLTALLFFLSLWVWAVHWLFLCASYSFCLAVPLRPHLRMVVVAVLQFVSNRSRYFCFQQF